MQWNTPSRVVERKVVFQIKVCGEKQWLLLIGRPPNLLLRVSVPRNIPIVYSGSQIILFSAVLSSYQWHVSLSNKLSLKIHIFVISHNLFPLFISSAHVRHQTLSFEMLEFLLCSFWFSKCLAPYNVEESIQKVCNY